jgi:hypothetical protein
VSLCGVRGSSVVTHTSPTVTSFPQRSEHQYTSSSPRASVIPKKVLLLVLYLCDSLHA